MEGQEINENFKIFNIKHHTICTYDKALDYSTIS